MLHVTLKKCDVYGAKKCRVGSCWGRAVRLLVSQIGRQFLSFPSEEVVVSVVVTFYRQLSRLKPQVRFNFVIYARAHSAYPVRTGPSSRTGRMDGDAPMSSYCLYCCTWYVFLRVAVRTPDVSCRLLLYHHPKPAVADPACNRFFFVRFFFLPLFSP